MCILLVLAAGLPGLSAQAQTPSGEKPINSDSEYAVLLGKWERPDGGYQITIKSAEADGKLDAAYANPRPLAFSKAEASRDGDAIKVFFELRAGGYNGSTYTLVYDPTEDELRGVYYQAVAQQKYDIQFQRIE